MRKIVRVGQRVFAAGRPAAKERDWDILILDINLPDRSGFDILHDVKRERPNMPVLILTVCSEDQFANGNRPPQESLSDREHQVFRMLATGKTVSQIAVDMNLSVKTISTYRGRVLDKMGMRTNAELTYYAVRNQLVE